MYFYAVAGSYVEKETDSEEETNEESCSESENDKSEDDDEDESDESSDSESKSSSRGDRGDVSRKDVDSGQQQQPPSSSSSKNGNMNEKVGSENHDATSSTSDITVSDIFGDKVSCAVSSSKRCADTSAGYNLSWAADSLNNSEDGSAEAAQGDAGKRSSAEDAETVAKKKKLDGSVNRNKSFAGVDDTGKSAFYVKRGFILVLY